MSNFLRGIDISQYQGQPNFDVLKQNIDFVIIRSSYGDGYTDPQFTRNRDEARRVGILRGFYHYSYAQYNTPEAEANWFLKTVGTPQDNEILCLDFEEKYADPVGWCKKFLDHLSINLNNYKPLVYLNLSQTKDFDWSPIVNANYGLWLALYDNDPTNAPNTPWPTVAMKQYTSSGQVQGISGNTDLSSFYGDLNAFNAYGYHPTDPCAIPKAALVQAAADRDQNWQIVIAVSQQLKINPDPNDKPGTSAQLVAKIRQLQQDSLTLATALQDTTNQFNDYKTTHTASADNNMGRNILGRPADANPPVVTPPISVTPRNRFERFAQWLFLGTK